MRKKRSLTLLEIMIVIFLITLITGAIGYNMKGSLDRGRVFRTKQAMAQLEDLLLMCVEEGSKPKDIERFPKEHLDQYNLAKDSEKLLQDGWGERFIIHYRKGKFEIESKALENYESRKSKSSHASGASD
ncbi:MAG: prepilin-type N-terminal cleavage/methylation domain-containing protein [Verrucomicrobiota bacterium]|nr:prepilin-type N-terminal cleavage/methylation domain-containing protein [Verrucomicrobiota bacterium]